MTRIEPRRHGLPGCRNPKPRKRGGAGMSDLNPFKRKNHPKQKPQNSKGDNKGGSKTGRGGRGGKK